MVWHTERTSHATVLGNGPSLFITLILAVFRMMKLGSCMTSSGASKTSVFSSVSQGEVEDGFATTTDSRIFKIPPSLSLFQMVHSLYHSVKNSKMAMLSRFT